MVDALASLVRQRGFTTVLFENSVVAADVAAGLAARIDSGVNWDLQDLQDRGGALVGVRHALNDTVTVDVGWVGNVRLAVFRIGLFEPVEDPVNCAVQRFEPEFADRSLKVTIAERLGSQTRDAVQLATADVIVAGGRGVRDRESLGLLEELADALGGVVGVSLPLVDRGWYPHQRQIGQTGYKVRPRLYLACGISGALAHRVGMEKSGLIVAINSDPAAPIFGICDGGVVGDLHEIVPELTRLVRQGRVSRPLA
jgi:electron transfer flavoprotein alpha subunit